MNNAWTLLDYFKNYNEKGLYPLHMPGHKRRGGYGEGLPYDIDFTEVPDLDDLHGAEGILKEAMDRTARLYGVKKTFYLVNGSTCGNLAAIRAAVPFGSEVLVARNCHKSVYHALELFHLKAHFAEPEILEDFGICGSVRPETVQEMLERYPASRAVILTSPTYEGILSDIASIAAIAHEKGLPLIVDAAHGAHLVPGLGERYGFPADACACGANLVIQSAHKTLTGLTQTAFLHVCGDLVPAEAVARELSVFETSSPSYPLMASLDACTALLLDEGDARYAVWQESIAAIRAAAAGLVNIRMLSEETDADKIYAFDPSKVFLTAGKGSGAWLYDALMAQGFVPEMRTADGVLLMTGPGDTPEGLLRFAECLKELDAIAASAAMTAPEAAGTMSLSAFDRETEAPMTIAAALLAPHESCPAAAAEGRILAQYLYVYPPGIPFGVPGERVTPALLQTMREMEERGLAVHREGRLPMRTDLPTASVPSAEGNLPAEDCPGLLEVVIG